MEFSQDSMYQKLLKSVHLKHFVSSCHCFDSKYLRHVVITYCRCLVLLVVYFVGGILLLRYWRGARGVEQIPNYQFWKSLPGLVKVCLMSDCL